jgi:type I restriction enzyme S subunit
MSKNNENKLVPRLRFPEFKNTQAWLLRTLNDVADMYQPKTISQSEFKDKGHLVYGANGVIGYYDRYNHETSQIAIACRGSSCGTVNFTEPKSWITGNAMVVNVDGFKGIDKKFMFYQLLVANFNYLITGSGQPQITGNIKNHKVVLTNLEEQQKIAACLSSLDDVINAESKKLEVLKEHKKGLLQNLFPQEGETVPKLRFKEFEDSGEWEEKKLEKMTYKIGDGIHTTPVYDELGEYFFINGNNLINGRIFTDEKTKRVSKEEFIKHKKDLNDNTILLSINGTIGNVSFYQNEKVVLGKSACYINPLKELNHVFLYYILQSSRVTKYFTSELTGSTIKNLSLESIRETGLLIPKRQKEQQKIADTLSSIDDLISAQSQKIETLKLHKKGLLQGLFPDVNEHNG